MQRHVLFGALIGALIASLTPCGYGIRTPGPSSYQVSVTGGGLPLWGGGQRYLATASEGEAWAWIGGVTFDRVAIPPGPEGQAIVDSPRVRDMANKAMAAWASIIALGGVVGGGLGLAYGRHRKHRVEPIS